ncbi:hypothetical protein ACFVU2_19935 [Leifsonia sp. NPDC058194]|uniref:hypothetical protein n=1 Tax=Leifsonia sp. NPDC058194 TaxID=3346374 RepID=UPI0036DEB20F
MRFKNTLAEAILIEGLYRLADNIRWARRHQEAVTRWSLIALVAWVGLSILIGQQLETRGWPLAYLWSFIGVGVWTIFVWCVAFTVLKNNP